VILLGVDLPPTLDAAFSEVSGKAVWYSFGTLVANAAARVLQIDPGELKVGVRAVRAPDSRLLGEVFIYDDVPGGAGYARSIEANLLEVLQAALQLGGNCANPDCSGACYHCLLEYSNQFLHPTLDRSLGASVLEFLLHGSAPHTDSTRLGAAIAGLEELARGNWVVEQGLSDGTVSAACVLNDGLGNRIGLSPRHPFSAGPATSELTAFQVATGVRPAVHSWFDIERRPFWVLGNLL
jgi:hypothetical protein